MTIIFLPLIASIIMVLVNFIFYLATGRKKSNDLWFRVTECFTVFFMPLLFLFTFDIYEINDCCTDSAVFSPEHRIGIYALIAVSAIAYGVTIFRKKIFAPLVEVLLNMMLILGVVINLVLCYHLQTDELSILWVLGNFPILLLLFMKLDQNHKLLTVYITTNKIELHGFLGTFSMWILKQNQAVKYPILLVLLAPLLVLVSLFLILFGQKPDAMIRVFTDTYKHGFSQLDDECLNVICGGHFLCSVGANGHKGIVKPIRYGERGGAKIICNRQLLVSNAFEDLIQEKLPKTHWFIRKNYNKVGNVVHRYYGVFRLKWVSNSIYFLMKPLEWLFLIILYSVDQNPENRIAKQYITSDHRQLIANSEKQKS